MFRLLVSGAAAVLAGHLAWSEVQLHYALQPTTERPANPTIVMLGDSHTQIANWPRLTGCPNIANFGIGGNTSAQMLERLPSVIALKPRAVFIMAGTNDSPDMDTAENLKRMREELAASSARVIVQSPPLRHAPADIAISFDESDLLPDGVHLRRSGYAKWRDAIRPLIETFCARSAPH